MCWRISGAETKYKHQTLVSEIKANETCRNYKEMKKVMPEMIRWIDRQLNYVNKQRTLIRNTVVSRFLIKYICRKNVIPRVTKFTGSNLMKNNLDQPVTPHFPLFIHNEGYKFTADENS